MSLFPSATSSKPSSSHCPLISTSGNLFPRLGVFPFPLFPASPLPLSPWSNTYPPFLASDFSPFWPQFQSPFLRRTPWCTQARVGPLFSQQTQYLSSVEFAKFEIKYFSVHLCVYMSLLLDPKFQEVKDYAFDHNCIPSAWQGANTHRQQ